MSEQPSAVECKELSRYFNQVPAVDKVSLNIPKGELFGLIGPNGAGKSTLMKMLTTLLPPSSGDGFINGISVTQYPSEVRKNIGYVPQLISADGSLTGYENLLLFSKLYSIPANERKERIQLALETMGLTKIAHRFVREYSGGMIRRLEIVQALLHHPHVLFLDEPTTGLDPVARKTLWEHLIQIHQRNGITIILTTHDMEEANQMCERVAIMLNGKIAGIGTTDSLKATVGPSATLSDVFIQYAGNSIESENAYYNVALQRRKDEQLK